MIPQKIRTLRQAKGLTLKELADKTQTTAGYISQLERELLTPAAIGGQKPSDLLLFTSRLSKGSWSNEERISHNAEEWIYVMEGQIEIIAGENSYSLRSGDCIYLKENIPHNIYNPGPKPAVCISAMTPSVFVSTVHP